MEFIMADIFDTITTGDASKGDIFDSIAPPSKTSEPSTVQKVLRATKNYYRPALEMGGAAIGAVAGIPADVATFNPAPSMVGGGLGYAAGKLTADYLDEQAGVKQSPNVIDRLAQSGKDFSLGAMFQGLGESGIQALKMAYKWGKGLGENGIAVTSEDIIKRAAEILNKNKSSNPIYATNAANATKTAEQIPGFKPSVAEATNDPGLIRLQRSLARGNSKAADIEMTHRATNQNALDSYIDNQFPQTNSIYDVLGKVKQGRDAITTNTANAQNMVYKTKGVLPVSDEQQTGRAVIEELDKARIPAKSQAEQLYKDLPNTDIAPTNTRTTIDSLSKDFLPGDEEVFPTRAINRINETLSSKGVSLGTDGSMISGKPKEVVGFQELHSLRKDIGRQINDAFSGANPNRELARKLIQIKNGIDADIEATMGSNNSYDIAKQTYADYAQKFRSGSVEQVLRKGQQASGRNTPDALIGKKMFTPDGADDFIRAVGKDNASISMESYAANDLLNKATNPTTQEIIPSALNSWVAKNKVVLDKYGITKNFENLQKAQATLDSAKQMETSWSKSVAAKMLNADPDKAIAAAFSGAEGVGAKNTGEIMNQLLAQVKGSPEALKGLQNSFKDFMYAKAKNSAKTIEGDNIFSNPKMQSELRKYDPAMKLLYGADSQQYKALQNVHKAVEMSSRSITSPLGGGSDTMELGSTGLNTIAMVVGLPGLKMGSTASLAIRLARKGLDSINNLSNQDVNQVLLRAMYDPELASNLLLAKNGFKPEVIDKRISAKLIGLGLLGTTKQTQNLFDRRKKD
jgi:hypothetical protein